MYGYSRLRKRALVVAFVVAVMLCGLVPAMAADKWDSAMVWTDDFDGPKLDKRWTWAREDPTHWSLGAHPGSLRITTQTGGIYGPTEKQKNILLMPAPKGDYRIVTKCTIDPKENFQYAGLMVYQGRKNYVQINRAFANVNSINFDVESNGVPINERIPETATTVYLRITKKGNTFEGDYSLDGETWRSVGIGTAKLFDARIGICAANNLPKVPHIPADFDFFKLYSFK